MMFQPLALAGLAISQVTGSPLLTRAAEPNVASLDVILTRTSNTGVNITIHNNGTTDLQLLRVGTILDTRGSPKLTVTDADKPLPFQGISITPVLGAALDKLTTLLKANENITVPVEIASIYDVPLNDSKLKVVARGGIQYAPPGFTKLNGTIPYSSNELTLSVSGADASAVPKAHLNKKRLVVDTTECNLDIAKNALSWCKAVAQTAASSIITDTASRVRLYFGDSSIEARSTIADRYNAIADECSEAGMGNVNLSCPAGVAADPNCDATTWAYAAPAETTIVMCPPAWQLSVEPTQCMAPSQSSLLIHQLVHQPKVFFPAVPDMEFGYNADTTMDDADKFSNADNYEEYAANTYFAC